MPLPCLTRGGSYTLGHQRHRLTLGLYRAWSVLLLVAFLPCGTQAVSTSVSGGLISTAREPDSGGKAPSVWRTDDAPRDQDHDTVEPMCDGLTRYVGLALKDVWHVYSFPLRWNDRDWLAATAAVIGVSAVAAFDEPVRDIAQKNRSTSLDEFVEVFEPFGSGYTPYVLGGFMLGGIILDRPRERNVAFDGFMANLIAAQNITPTLKRMFGRRRPNEGDDVYEFKPYSGHSSFPSGHATRAFALASVIATHYENRWVNVIAYGSAGIVALARVVHNVHFASDVVAGALIGTSVGRSLVQYNRHERNKSHPPAVTMTLSPSPGGVVLTTMVAF